MSSDSCKDGASTKSSDGVCEMNNMLQNMSTTDDKEVVISVCANCGKEGTNVTNTCNKCNSVKYCNATCKKKHRTKHKKQCERRVAELHDEKLFKQPPLLDEDCPICFLRMPSLGSGQVYMACCGKIICRGCVHAADERDKKRLGSLCPFCRTPTPTTEKEMVKRYKKRMELNDAMAIYNLGAFSTEGQYGLPRNMAKALELYHRAAELGYAGAYYNIGNAYRNGRGVERDMKKAEHYYELAAMDGVIEARNNLGATEEVLKGNVDRAIKHYLIAIEGGNKMSLESVKQLYIIEHATKEDYTKALGKFQEYVDEVKSKQRDEAAAFNADWKYY